MKCQFCSLGFTSIYKIIPHIYFGHRKKVTKYVREHGEVVLHCPAKCDFKASRPVGKGSGPDLVFPALSQVLLFVFSFQEAKFNLTRKICSPSTRAFHKHS